MFRIACENVLQLLRDNKDTLMSVLDAFIHDPLVEWEDEKRKMVRPPSLSPLYSSTVLTTPPRAQEREASRQSVNTVKASVDLRMLAKNALLPIEKKLKGIYTTSRERAEREISTSNLVQMLIQEAADDANLVSPGSRVVADATDTRVAGQDVPRLGAMALRNEFFTDGLEPCVIVFATTTCNHTVHLCDLPRSKLRPR